MTIVDGSHITVAEAGTYNIAFSAQVTKTGGGAETVYFWLRTNGIDIPDTNTGLLLSGNNDKQVAAWNFFVTLDAGEHATLMWASSNAAVQILYVSAADTPFGPAIPSMILTVNQVG